MLSHRLIFRCLSIAGIVALAPVSAAMAESGTFDLSLAGIRIGTLGYAATEENGRYAAKGSVRASPLARAVMDVDIDTTAKGTVSGNAYRPSYFEATEVKDGKTIKTVHTFENGVPNVKRTPKRKKPQKHAASPKDQKGTLDSMTTAFAILRDRPTDLACALNIELFDGARRSNIRFAKAEKSNDGGIICHGEYRRLQGYSPKEMGEKSVWPFIVLYEPVAKGMRVTELQIPSKLGKIRMVRR